MTTFDCKSMHYRCNARCCGVVPIPIEIWNDNQSKIVTQPIQVLNEDDHILPITHITKCVFLNEDYSCNIYENRPDICIRFGDESHPMLCCPYLNKQGKKRCRQNQRKIERQSSDYISKLKIIQ